MACNRRSPRAADRRRGYWTLHAEIAACLGLDDSSIRNADVYSFRATRDGRIADSAACVLCRSLLSELGVKRVFYTTAAEPYYGVLKL